MSDEKVRASDPESVPEGDKYTSIGGQALLEA